MSSWSHLLGNVHTSQAAACQQGNPEQDGEREEDQTELLESPESTICLLVVCCILGPGLHLSEPKKDATFTTPEDE